MSISHLNRPLSSKIAEVTAVADRIKFQNEDFIIASARLVKSSDPDDPLEFSIKGNVPDEDLYLGMEYQFWGRWDKTSAQAKKYGPTFAFQTFIPAEPLTRRGIITYLVDAGQGKGLGPRTAEKLFEKFRGQTIDILRDHPEVAAAAVDRFKVEDAIKVSEKLKELAHIQTAWVKVNELLHGRGFPKNTAKEALKRWGNEAPARIAHDPYKLMAFRGCGWLKVDSFYKDLGLPLNALKRQAYCITYRISSDNNGHTWLSVDEALRYLEESVGDTELSPEKAIMLARRGKIIRTRVDEFGKLWIADIRDAVAEENVARCIAESADEVADWPEIEWSDEDDGLPMRHQFTELKKATAGTIGLFCGAPGVGKSFVTSFLIKEIIRRHGVGSVAVGTPTGKASQRSNEYLRSRNLPPLAKTIHSLLGVESADGGWSFKHKKDRPLSFRFLIIDEVSMTDTALMSSLLSARARGTHMLLTGDVNQLPPIGRGAPLRDFIAAGLPYGELTEIHRNAGTIVRACHAIKDNRPFPTDSKINLSEVPPRNLKMIHATKSNAKAKIVEVVKKFMAMPGIDPIWDVQTIVAVNKRSELSREKLNETLQELLNPAGQTLKGAPFRVNDKVTCLKNSFFPLARKSGDSDERAWIANGDFGRVLEVHETKTIIKFQSHDDPVLVPRGAPKKKADGDGKENGGDDKSGGESDDAGTGCDVSLAYACTAHRLQGSSSPFIIVAIDEYPGATGRVGICDRNWLYTAISRAEKVCFLVGSVRTARAICNRVFISRRKTFLADDIRQFLREAGTAFASYDELFDPAKFGDACYEPIA